MSYNFSFTADDTEAAKAELCERNSAEGGHMPEGTKQAVQALIDALGAPPEGHVINVACYGHADTSTTNTGPSNVTAAITHVAA